MLRAKILVCIAAIAAPTLPTHSNCLPWNATGHRIVALIAWSQMSEHARDGAVALLRSHPRFEDDFENLMPQAVRDDESLQGKWIFMHAATWPDIARDFSGDDAKKYHHATWHYINWPVFLDEQTEQAIPKPPVNFNTTWTAGMDESNLNAVQALAMVRATLDKPATPATQPTQAVMLCWLEHLVGDLHQPLHGSALFATHLFPKGDKGGNSIGVVGHKNLHSFWDATLGKTGSSVQSLSSKATGMLQDPELQQAGQKAKKSLSPKTWRKESTRVATEDVYTEAILNAVAEGDDAGNLADVTLAKTYIQKAESVAKKRAVEAGFRLAALCENYLGGQ